VARGAGFVPHHRELVIVEDQLAEQYDLLKAIQRCQSCVVDRFSFDAVDLKSTALISFWAAAEIWPRPFGSSLSPE
jgi:hypothetical protein